MEEEFVTLEIATELKSIGFNEPCIKLTQLNVGIYGESKESNILQKPIKNSDGTNIVTHPLWQQATKWFRKNYKLIFPITENAPEFVALGGKKFIFSGISYGADTYEEAESIRLLVLIELVKRFKAATKPNKTI